MKDPENQSNTMMVELMGLSQRRVKEFVDKNVPNDRKDFVKQTLEKNPILMSVSAITFYCAALCDVLSKDSHVHKLTTYSRITAYIMQVEFKMNIRELI